MNGKRDTIIVVVLGQPIPYARAGRNGRRSFTSPRCREYRGRFVQAAREALDAHGAWDTTGPMRAHAHAAFADRRRRDLDNVAKMFGDAGNGILWDDDSQIDDLRVTRGLERDAPHLFLTVTRLKRDV